MQPIPAEAPIGGMLWEIFVPAALFAVSCAATFLLYRHFARAPGDDSTTRVRPD